MTEKGDLYEASLLIQLIGIDKDCLLEYLAINCTLSGVAIRVDIGL